MRPSWDRYFIDLAHFVSKRSTCDRLNVGAVITKNNRIISTGYNGSIPGGAHCIDPSFFIKTYSGNKIELNKEEWETLQTHDLLTQTEYLKDDIPLKDIGRKLVFMKGGHRLVDNHCTRVVHAETNAIYSAARNGISTQDASIYVTHHPCLNCFNAIISSGIKTIIYDQDYKNSPIIQEEVDLLGNITIRKIDDQ